MAQFDGNGSFDPDGLVVAYDWTFGNDTVGTGAIVSRAYGASGVFTVALTVTDDFGDTDADTAVVTVKTVAQAIQDLSALVKSYNFKQGIANSLDAKLENAQQALEAANAG